MWTLVHPLDIRWITEIIQDILWLLRYLKMISVGHPWDKVCCVGQFSKRCSKDVLSMFSGRLSEICVLWIYLNMRGCRKILIGHFMTFYEIL